MRLTVYNRFAFQLETRYFGDDSELLLVPLQLHTRQGEGWMAPLGGEQILVPLSDFIRLAAQPHKENPMSKESPTVPAGQGAPLPPLGKDPSPSHLPPHPGTGVPANPLPPKK